MQPSGVGAHPRITDLAALIAVHTARPGVGPAFPHNDSHRGIRASTRRFHPTLLGAPEPSRAFVRQGATVHLYGATPDIDAATDAVR